MPITNTSFIDDLTDGEPCDILVFVSKSQFETKNGFGRFITNCGGLRCPTSTKLISNKRELVELVE